MAKYQKALDNLEEAFNIYRSEKGDISCDNLAKLSGCSTARLYREFKKAGLRFSKN